MDREEKKRHYSEVLAAISALIDGENDPIAIMASVVCELHHTFPYYHWTGFYRLVSPGIMKVGPYQGTHGCLTISFDRGVCGAAARSGQTQLVADVNSRPDHIACSSTTRSEIVVPVFNSSHQVIAVFDVDSNDIAAFDEIDQQYLEQLFDSIGNRIG